MGGKTGAKVQVNEHYMTMHVGFCASGEGLELVALKVGEKEAWRGRLSRNTVVKVVKDDLFGGNKKEGGVRGLFWWLNGNAKQLLPGPLAQRLGLTTATCPGFRGLASVFFTGFRNDDTSGTSFLWPDFASLNGGEGDERGFYWAANNPYLKPISGILCRAPQGLNPSIALIQLPNDSNGNTQFAANPGHIIFEAMTNRDWGMGESFGAFNIGSFEQCAQTLFDEDFGLNMIWTRQSKIEDFVKEVLDHIQGAVFVDPATGKHTMKLLRAVDPSIVLPRLSPDNGNLSNFKMKLWGDIANEIVVTWTNPETNKEETVSAQDLAAISMQGSQPASDSRNYYGVASQALAIRLAERDLAAVVNPIITCDIEVTKALWRTVIHDVLELSWPERDIDSVIFRVSQVTKGSNPNKVVLSMYEDIFSLDRASYLNGSGTGWVNPEQDPQPLTKYQLGTAPAFMTAAALGLTDASELVYPEVISAITIGPETTDDVNYDLIGYTATVSGDVVQENLGERTLRGTWLTQAVLNQEVSTLIPSIPNITGNPPRVGQFVLIGAVGDTATEIAVVKEISSAGYLLDRGMLDTTPKTWPIGTRAWAIPDDTEIPDVTRRSAFETASYHFLPRTSKGLLPIEDAPQHDIVLSERPHLPNRPANVSIDGVTFGTFNLGTSLTMTVYWARRNRIEESTQAFKWNDGDTTPEVNQNTRIYLLRANRSLITTIDAISGTSQIIARSTFEGNSPAIVRVVSIRDGLESLQGHEILVTMS